MKPPTLIFGLMAPVSTVSQLINNPEKKEEMKRQAPAKDLAATKDQVFFSKNALRKTEATPIKAKPTK